MKSNKKFGVCMIALVAVLFSCNSKQKEEKKTDEKPLVRLETVHAQPVEQSQDFTATVEANIVNNISPSMPLRINKILVEVGDRVHKGQVLALMDRTNLVQSKTQLENIEIEYKRAEELYKVGGASKQALDAQKMQLDVARSAYQNLVDNTQLLSPIDGIVTARNYDNGDMFGAEPVVTVEQISPVKILINVSESFYMKVSKGMPVKVKVDAFDNEEFTGKVNLIYPTIDPQTRTFPVEVIMANTNQKVRPGMFVRVTMNFGVKDYVVVPDQAVVKQSGAGDRFIYVYKDGKVSFNKVEIGRQLGTTYEVISGVESGDQVVVAGQSRLANGMEVEVENAK